MMQRDEILPTEILQLAEQSEEIVKKSAPASIPLLLLTLCASMSFYVIFLLDGTKSWMQSFMGMAVLQLLPLVVLKLKIWTCPERLSLTPIMLEKCLILHLFVLFTRCYWNYFALRGMTFRTYVDPVMFIVGLAMLHKVFGVKTADMVKHSDVSCLLGFSLLLAFVTTLKDHDGRNSATHFLDNAGNFADVLAFVPVALLVCNESDVENFTPGTAIPLEAKQRAYHFFAFVTSFYLVEDVVEPYFTYESNRYLTGIELSVVAHAAHFVMLVDFVGYFLCKTWFPSADKVGAIAKYELVKESESAGLLDGNEEGDEEDQI